MVVSSKAVAAGVANGDVTFASSQLGEPLAAGYATVWYSLSAPRAGTLNIHVTAGFAAQVTIGVSVNGTVGGIEVIGFAVGSDDVVDAPATVTTSWPVATYRANGVVAGKTYVVAVGATDASARGSFSLRWAIV